MAVKKKGMGTMVLFGVLGAGALLLASKSKAGTTSSAPPNPNTFPGSTTGDQAAPGTQADDSDNTGIAPVVKVVQSATDALTDDEKIQSVEETGNENSVLAYNMPADNGDALPEVIAPDHEKALIEKGEVTEDMVIKHPALAHKIIDSNTKKHKNGTLKNAAIAVGAGAGASTAAAVILNNTKNNLRAGQKKAIIVGAGVATAALVGALEIAANRKRKATRKVKFVVNKAALVNTVAKAGGTNNVVKEAQQTGKSTAATAAIKLLAAAPKTKKVAKPAKKKGVKKPVAKKKGVKAVAKKKPVKKSPAKKAKAKSHA